MRERFIFISVFVFISTLVFASAVSLSGSCIDQSNFNTLVCGSAPDSALGFGAVDICGTCSPCGLADGICPEDFYTSASGRGSCRFCPDPDCSVKIDGYVEDTLKKPIKDAKIFALYNPDIKEDLKSKTDSFGHFRASVRSGFVKLFVEYQDFDSKIISTNIPRKNTGIVKTVNFTDSYALEPGVCTAQCTDTFGTRCKASCNGVNGCEFNNYSVSNLCDDKIAGTRVFLTSDSYITCCEENINIQGERIHSTKVERIASAVGFRNDYAGGSRGVTDNLVTFTQRTRSKGEKINLQVAVWNTKTN